MKSKANIQDQPELDKLVALFTTFDLQTQREINAMVYGAKLGKSMSENDKPKKMPKQ